MYFSVTEEIHVMNLYSLKNDLLRKELPVRSSKRHLTNRQIVKPCECFNEGGGGGSINECIKEKNNMKYTKDYRMSIYLQFRAYQRSFATYLEKYHTTLVLGYRSRRDDLTTSA